MVKGCEEQAESVILLPSTMDSVRNVLADIVGTANLERALSERGFASFYFCFDHSKELSKYFPDWF